MFVIPSKDDPVWQSFKLFVEEPIKSMESAKTLAPWREDLSIKALPELRSLENFEIELAVEGDRKAHGGYPLKITACVYLSSKSGDLFPENLWFSEDWFSENPQPSWDEVYPIIEGLIQSSVSEFRGQFLALQKDIAKLLKE